LTATLFRYTRGIEGSAHDADVLFHPFPGHIPMTSLTINGRAHTVTVPQDTPILWTLRDELGLTGTKFGCGAGLCGACTVHLDGVAIRSCITPISSAVGKQITTIEQVENDKLGAALQVAWVEAGVPQCGYCQGGQIMSAIALLKRIPKPADNDIDDAMSGNLCRCGTYTRIRAAIKTVAAQGVNA
jgi:isoquinoline 1-oxidoreductase alpha subunit